MAKAAKKNAAAEAKASAPQAEEPNCLNCQHSTSTGLHLVCAIRLPAFVAQVNDPRRRIVSVKNVCALHKEQD